VQISNADSTNVITTILAIPNYRLRPTGKSAFMFWETPAGLPRALRAWFYPGDNFGQEFAYPSAMYTELAANRKKDQTQTQTQTASVSEADRSVEAAPQPEPAPTPAAPEPVAASQPAETPAPEAAPAPEPASAPAPAELPHTASYYPLVALFGLASLAVFMLTGWRGKRSA
jgi:hypothetical protein